MSFFLKTLAICLLVGTAFAQIPVTVEAFDEQGNNQSQITLRLRMTNNTSDTLSGVRARYFIRHDVGSDLNISPYYTAGATLSLDTLGDFLAINIDLPQLAPGMFPNSSGISVGINYADYSEIDKTDSLGSYPGTGSFAQADKIPVYVGGSLVAGVSPVGDDKPKIRIVGFQPENTPGKNAWVKIRNVGKHDARLSYLSLRGASGVRLPLESPGVTGNTLAKGDSLIVCAESPCENGMVLQGLVLGNVGELMLDYGANTVDYVVWGAVGSNAADAVAKGIWHDTADYIRTVEKLYGPSLPYESGSFFRRMYLEGKSSMDWLAFSPSEMDVAEGCLPNSVPFSWNSGVKIVLPHDAPMHFAWVPVPGALSYRLNIFSEDSVQVYQEETGATYTDVNLPEGTYLWGVESSDRPVGSASWGSAPQKSARFRVSRLAESASYVEAFSLNVEPLAARKDTKLLVPNWGMYADIRGWDQSHVGNPHWDEEESWRCWAVAIHELNRYFGGNLTQDEIKMHGMAIQWPEKDSILWSFPFGGNGEGNLVPIMKTMSWALGGVQVHHFVEPPTASIIQYYVSHDMPLYALTLGHAMIVDAYRVREDGSFEIEVLNPHNDGSSEWRGLDASGLVEYFLYQRPGQVLNSDSLVDSDIDEDGLMAYDEIYRFHTDPNNPDSDGDSIYDKTEIWSYVIRTIPKITPEGTDSNASQYGLPINVSVASIEKEMFADVDGDGFRAELDTNSDNDELLDGEEDLNRNGTVDEGETDPYDAGNGQRPVYMEDDVPENFALYSLGRLSMNDGSQCRYYADKSVSGPCSFAAESKMEYYAVSLASSEKQSVLHAKGGVLLRNHNEIEFVYIYNSADRKPVLNIQKGAVALGHAYVPEENWVWSVNQNLASVDVGNLKKIVKSGEGYILTDGTRLSKLKVESGGFLWIGKGEMFVGELQLEAGSVVDYSNPGYSTVLHVNQNVIWRANVDLTGVNPNKIRDKMFDIAKGFKMIYHESNSLFIEGDWAGTIYAPNAKIILGQANKTIYGRFVGNGISVHQYAKLNAVRWIPNRESNVVYLNKEE